MQEISIGKLKKLEYTVNEAYKSFRTNLQFCGKEVKVIGFTSCIPNEGKTAVAFNISQALVADGKKVLYVDADMRKSVLIGRYKISKANRGLSHFLSGYKTMEDVLCKTNIDNFYMVLSGPTPPNPSELINSDRFKEMIGAARTMFDYVIVDLPPLGSVTDSAVAAPSCDGMCMVVSANAISYKFAQNIKDELDKTGCRVLGAVLNKVPMRKNKYYGKYYGYGRYYGKTKTKFKSKNGE